MTTDLGHHGRRLRALVATWVGFVALVAAVAAGSAQAAPPPRNAERRCVDAGGQFLWEQTQYSCTGLSDASVIPSAERQCRNSYKGWAFSWWQDPLTGTWNYICSR